MPLLRLGHINLKTDRFAETVAFYETLGLRRSAAETMADKDRNVWMRTPDGAASVHVNERDGPVPAPAGALDHIAFDGDDRPGVEAMLRAAGLPFTARRFPGAGLVQLYLRDPNGVMVELTFAEPDTD